MSDCKILFMPDEITVCVSSGTTLLSALDKADLHVNSLCGGDGVCGRCRVIVKEGNVKGGSTDPFSRDEIKQGYVLACEARVESDLVVELPPLSRRGPTPEAGADVPQLADVSELKRRGIPLSPLVQKTYTRLPKPSLDDIQSDLQRLEHALSKTIETDGFQTGLKVTRSIHDTVRKSDWKVTAMTGHRGLLTEIVDVTPGDTSKRNMCIVADIGTTTVVCHLVDLNDGRTLGQAARYNSQATYGADIIRRIIHSAQSPTNRDALRESIVGDLNQLIGELIAEHRIGAADISLLSVAGNTAMTHLLLGLPAEHIRKEPYTGVAYNLPPFRAAEIGIKIHPRGLLYCLPSVAGFVGADIVAGVFAIGMNESPKLRMLIDIGTNGEIVVGNSDFLICASASAGPAFEGSECSGGMYAAAGAIDHIKLLNADKILSYSTISSAPPVGICGTGYVDLIAELLRSGAIDRTGALQPQAAPRRIRKDADGLDEYVVISKGEAGGDEDIVITQADITNILRAKGAIYAAEMVLLHALDLTFDDVDEIMVAGAFGNFLNIDSAVFIGLIPDVPKEKLRFVGNTSLAGAKLAALSSQCYQEIFNVASKMTYFELSTDPTFMDQFVSACFFPHTDLERFPTVMAALNEGKD